MQERKRIHGHVIFTRQALSSSEIFWAKWGIPLFVLASAAVVLVVCIGIGMLQNAWQRHCANRDAQEQIEALSASREANAALDRADQLTLEIRDVISGAVWAHPENMECVQLSPSCFRFAGCGHATVACERTIGDRRFAIKHVERSNQTSWWSEDNPTHRHITWKAYPGAADDPWGEER